MPCIKECCVKVTLIFIDEYNRGTFGERRWRCGTHTRLSTCPSIRTIDTQPPAQPSEQDLLLICSEKKLNTVPSRSNTLKSNEHLMINILYLDGDTSLGSTKAN